MKYSIIKWFGSILIITISIFIAVKTTFKGKISEEKYYIYNLPQAGFVLKDGKKVRLSLGLAFKTKKLAKEITPKQEEILLQLKQFFLLEESTSLVEVVQKQYIKSKIILEFNKLGIPVEFVLFNTVPKII